MQLRDYQSKLAMDIYDAFDKGSNGVVAVAPTGAGKMCLLTYLATMSSQPTLILFHVRELYNKCLEWLECWDSDFVNGDRILVETMQTYIKKHGKLGAHYKRIIIDEGHHAKASTYTAIFDMMPQAKRLSFTATPVRLDGQGLVDNKYFDTIVFGPEPRELEQRGFLAPIRLFTQPSPLDLDSLRTRAGDFVIADIEKQLKHNGHGKIMGDAIPYYKKYVNDMPALACGISIKHAEMVAKAFNEAGVPAMAVHGKMNRDGIIESYTRGDIKVLTYCQVFGEGVDLPDAVAMFYMRPTKSISVWKQNCGRVARKPYDDKVAFVFDFVGQANSMGHPYDNSSKKYWLDSIYESQEKKIKKNEKSTPKVYERCDKCALVYDALLKNCPSCGHNSVHAREIKRIEGDLKEQKRIDDVLQKELHKITALKELMIYAKAKGYKPGWAWHRFKQIQEFGHKQIRFN